MPISTLRWTPAAGFALLAGFLLVLYRRESWRRAGLAARVAALEAEFRKIKSAPETRELRVERFGLLWYPLLTYSSRDRSVTAVTVGMPHCQRCVAALKLNGSEWSCPECRDSRPDTVSDAIALDSVVKEAAKQFLERHKDYRVSLKKG